MQFKTQFSGKMSPSDEKTSKELLVEPDLSLSVQELLKNHTRGQKLPDNSGNHIGDYPIPLFQDITEKEEWIAEMQNLLSDKEADLKQQLAELEELKRPKVPQEPEKLPSDGGEADKE